jgi:hypothetical protein
MSSILLTWFNHFYLYCADSFLTDSTSGSSEISSFLQWPNKLYPAVCHMSFMSSVFSLLRYVCYSVQISRPYKSDGITKILCTFKQDSLWTKFSFKILLKSPRGGKKCTYFWSYVLPHKLSNSMEQSPWEANSHLASQEIPCLLWNLKVYYCPLCENFHPTYVSALTYFSTVRHIKYIMLSINHILSLNKITWPPANNSVLSTLSSFISFPFKYIWFTWIIVSFMCMLNNVGDKRLCCTPWFILLSLLHYHSVL